MEIDQQEVLQLFEDRANLYGQIPTLNVALFQEKHGDLAQRRDEIERARITEIVSPQPHWWVLDVGCGTGRWAFHLAPFVEFVAGFDISPALIEICRKEADGIVRFDVASVDEFSYPGSIFDLVIIAGVCLFTNDDQWPGLIGCLREVTRPDSLIAVREPMGTRGRFELDKVWSQELEREYSAIYRDPDWFRGAFGTFCRLEHQEDIYPELEKWDETVQKFMLFRVIR